MAYLDAAFVTALLTATNGAFFSISFEGRGDGKSRTHVGRTGVTKHLKGGSLPYVPKDHNLFNFYSVTKAGYRNVNLDKVTEVRFGGVIYKAGA